VWASLETFQSSETELRKIEAFYAERPMKPLAHYTSAQGLCGSLTSGTLWATHIQFLNDSKEFIHATGLAKAYMQRIKSSARFSGFVELIERMIERVDNMPGSTWVISLSTQCDLLSQWRGYCSGGGYNLTFDPEKLEDLAKKQLFVLNRCTYDRTHQAELIEELVEYAIDSYHGFTPDKVLDSGSAEEDKRTLFCAKWFFPKMSRLASTMKDPSFHEEEEWRLIGGLYTPHVVPSHRVRGSILVPHREFDFKDPDGVTRCISEILIGPNPNQNLADLGIFFFKQKIKIESVITRRSEIPFRA